MAEHDHITTSPTPRLGRRSLAFGAGASLAVPSVPAIATASPINHAADAELIRLRAEYAELDRDYRRIARSISGASLYDPEEERCENILAGMVPRRHKLADAITSCPARTPEGISAKATAVWHQLSDDAEAGDGPTSDEVALAWSLVCDMLRKQV